MRCGILKCDKFFKCDWFFICDKVFSIGQEKKRCEKDNFREMNYVMRITNKLVFILTFPLY